MMLYRIKHRGTEVSVYTFIYKVKCCISQANWCACDKKDTDEDEEKKRANFIVLLV